MITILKNNIITDKLVFEAKDGDTPVGSVVCTTDGETLFVEKLETQYIMLVDGLMRTAMNYAFNHFINKCTVNMQSETVQGSVTPVSILTPEASVVSLSSVTSPLTVTR